MLLRAAGCWGGAEKQALCLSRAKAAQQQMLSRHQWAREQQASTRSEPG